MGSGVSSLFEGFLGELGKGIGWWDSKGMEENMDMFVNRLRLQTTGTQFHKGPSNRLCKSQLKIITQRGEQAEVNSPLVEGYCWIWLHGTSIFSYEKNSCRESCSKLQGGQGGVRATPEDLLQAALQGTLHLDMCDSHLISSSLTYVREVLCLTFLDEGNWGPEILEPCSRSHSQ